MYLIVFQPGYAPPPVASYYPGPAAGAYPPPVGVPPGAHPPHGSAYYGAMHPPIGFHPGPHAGPFLPHSQPHPGHAGPNPGHKHVVSISMLGSSLKLKSK